LRERRERRVEGVTVTDEKGKEKREKGERQKTRRGSFVSQGEIREQMGT